MTAQYVCLGRIMAFPSHRRNTNLVRVIVGCCSFPPPIFLPRSPEIRKAVPRHYLQFHYLQKCTRISLIRHNLNLKIKLQLKQHPFDRHIIIRIVGILKNYSSCEYVWYSRRFELKNHSVVVWTRTSFIVLDALNTYENVGGNHHIIGDSPNLSDKAIVLLSTQLNYVIYWW